jgi:hypothetical protein
VSDWHAHVNTAGQVRIREFKLKVELICSLRQPAITTQDEFVLKERREAIAKVFCRFLAATSAQVIGCGPESFTGRTGILEDLRVPVKRDDHVRNACWSENAQAHTPGHQVAWRVLSMGIVGLDVEVGNASRLSSEGRCDARKYAASRRSGGGGAVDN